MRTKRAPGKKLIGAQASAAIWEGVDEWLRRNPRKSVSDFVIEASMEKLNAEKIPYDSEAALFDGRRRTPGAGKYTIPRPAPYLMNDLSSASQLGTEILNVGLSAAEQRAAAKRKPAKTAHPKAKAVRPPATPPTEP